MTDLASDPRIATIAKAGRIRLALFLPQYSESPAGVIKPIGAGVVANELIGELAQRLGIEPKIVPQPTPPKSIETLNAGGADVMILGIEEPRRKLVDFTQPVIQFDYAYLVPAASPIAGTVEVDQPGRRICVVQGHASWMALKRVIAHAEIVGTDLPDEAFALIRDGKVDAFALPREQLIDYAAMLPGSRILQDGFGINDVGLAVAKGNVPLLDYFGEFVEDAKRDGTVSRILDAAELTSRGFNVGPGASVA